MKNLKKLSLVLVLFSVQTLAAEDEQIPGIMAPLRQEILALQPYIASKELFKKSRQHTRILGHLRKLEELSSSLEAHSRLKTPGFEVPAEILQRQLEDTRRVFQEGSKGLAYRMLNESLKACSSCHTQIQSDLYPRWNFEDARLKGGILDKANFWYTTRSYGKALQLYESAILVYPKEGVSKSDLELSLERILAVSLRIQRSPEQAIKRLMKIYENKSIPTPILSRVSYWIDQLKALPVGEVPKIKKGNAQKLESFAENYLSSAEEESFTSLNDAHLVSFLYVSGLLLEFTNKFPKETTPEILYWIAVCDKWLNEQFFFSISNMHLKQCVEKFPESKTAKRCYAEYEEQVMLESTGSSGVNLAPEDKKELERLKGMLKK